MNNNRYKSAMQDEKFDEKRLDELCELLKNYDFAQSAEQSAKKPRKNIRLSVILAAALAIAAIGCTTVAATGTGMFGFKSYFDGVKEKYEISDDVPMAADPNIYAAEVNINAKSAGEHKPKIVPKVSGLVGDGYELFVDIEVDANAIEIPDNIPEDALFGFRRITSAQDDGLIDQQVELIPLQEDGIYRYNCHYRYVDHVLRRGDLFEVFLYDFGYISKDGFVVLEEGKFSLPVENEQLNTIGSFTKKSGPQEVKGVMLEVSLSPISMVISGSYSKRAERRLDNDKSWLGKGAGTWPFEFYMRDGTVIGSEEYFHDTAFYGLFSSIDGKVDWETDTFYDHYGFNVPIDVDEVVAVALYGVRFDFETAQDAE